MSDPTKLSDLPHDLPEIERRIRHAAYKLADDAGRGGLASDGGARELLTILKVWQQGLRGEVPESILETLRDPRYPRWLEEVTGPDLCKPSPG